MRNFPLLLLALSLYLTSGCASRHPRWDWSNSLPSQVNSSIPAQNRDMLVISRFFKDEKNHIGIKKQDITVKQLLGFLGRPDGFSPQYIHGQRRSSTITTEHGGTLRFLLDDGGEIHAWTPDFSTIYVIVAYPLAHHSHAYLLYNKGLTDTRNQGGAQPQKEKDKQKSSPSPTPFQAG